MICFQGVIKRSLGSFPSALMDFESEMKNMINAIASTYIPTILENIFGLLSLFLVFNQ